MGLRATVISNDAFRAGDCGGMHAPAACTSRLPATMQRGARKAWAQSNNKLRTASFACGGPPSFVVRARSRLSDRFRYKARYNKRRSESDINNTGLVAISAREPCYLMLISCDSTIEASERASEQASSRRAQTLRIQSQRMSVTVLR